MTKGLSMWKPDVCVYHFPCDDGFASAWIAKKKWPDLRLAPTNYGLPFPEKDIDGKPLDIEGKDVLIADFSYKPAELARLGERATSVRVLDHHKTAEADLRDYTGSSLSVMRNFNGGGVLAYFNMEHSGAALTWDFCFPDDPMPVMIQFIEDRDLWRFALPETRPFSLYLRSFPYDLDVWGGIADQVENDANLVIGEALAINRFFTRQVADIVLTATRKSIGKWKDIPTAHASYEFVSEVAHQLLQKHPDAPFAAVVVDAYGDRTWSLRSEDARQDVSEVAKQFGGGGHRNAAGFRVPI
jgi:oligoribonuclease NrnB/cAMP/cGMP phosphodiesterase (DHH superfamily)